MISVHFIEKFLLEYGILKYTIHPNGHVDVFQNVDISNTYLRCLPVVFNTIYGNFKCTGNIFIRSFQNFPKRVEGNCLCFHNKISSFKNSPRVITGDFNCSHNNFRVFQGFPEEVGGHIFCDHNKHLHSFQGAPLRTSAHFMVNDCNLKTFENCPQYIEGTFNCNNNSFKSLLNFPKVVKGMTYFGTQDNLPQYYSLNYNRLSTVQKVVYQKYQHYYEIWKPELDILAFDGFIKDIHDGLL